MENERGAPERQLPTVVAEELLQAGDSQRGSFDHLPPESQRPEQARSVWRWIFLFSAVTAAFIALCWVARLGLFPSGTAVLVPLTLGVLFVVWLTVGFLALDRAVKLGHQQFTTPLLGHWPTFRWVYFLGAVFAPILGQLWSLWGAISNWRAARDTVAVTYLILSLGWPAMYGSAYFALSPSTALSGVKLSGAAQETRVELRPEQHFTPLNSLVLVYGSGGVLWAVMILAGVGLRRQQRCRARAAAGASVEPDLLAAGEVLLHGEVELTPGDAFAVRSELFQNGKETQDTDGDWSHRWEVDHQQVKVNPFTLKLSSGKRVRVEADSRLLLRHPLSQTQPVHRSRRLRVAELVGGERVSVTGQLAPLEHPGEVTARWLLRPTSHSPMIISSTPLDRPFRRRARIYGLLVAWVLVVGVVGHLLLAPYHLSLWTGEPAEAELMRASFSRGSQDDSDTYALELRLPGGQELDQPVGTIPADIWSRLEVGSVMPVRLVRAWPSRAQVGTWPTAFFPFALVLALAIWGVGRGFLFYADWGEDWYEDELFTETGWGRLPEAEEG